ncbi:Hypp6576 [Branchiostoma lanceolatum]|uniref:Hypp6576 protein n=1 Tax=Branchiostoma lanceolatum TaxID=7740 RepID=A0A8J9YV62_BRALA|nr:Hypp6576 [Branchiostoma lanceolatum]
MAALQTEGIRVARGRVYNALRRIDGIGMRVESCFPNVTTWDCDAMLDIKTFPGNARNDLGQHGCPHAFTFTNGHDGQPVFEYNDFASDEGCHGKLPRNDEVRLVEQLPLADSKPDLVDPKLERFEIDKFQKGLEAFWQTGKKMALDAYTTKQARSQEFQDSRKDRIIATLWPEALLKAWSENRPTPPPQFTQGERTRIDNLYKSYNKSKKTSESMPSVAPLPYPRSTGPPTACFSVCRLPPKPRFMCPTSGESSSSYVLRSPNHAHQTSPGGAGLWPMTGKIPPPVGDDLGQEQPCDPASHTIYELSHHSC